MELKANELRIGNCILKNGSNYIIDTLFFVDVYDGTAIGFDLQPIPLTEEILLKCGFEYYGRITGWTISNHSINNYSGKFVFYIEKNYEIEVEFLHHLQNLYFSLTNEELTVNL